MRIGVDTEHFDWTAFDLVEGREIPLLLWADDETGQYEAYDPGPNGQPYYDSTLGEVARVFGASRLVLVAPGDPLPIIVEAR